VNTPYEQQDVNEDDIDAVAQVLESGYA